jgi:hypothetical protein
VLAIATNPFRHLGWFVCFAKSRNYIEVNIRIAVYDAPSRRREWKDWVVLP